MKVVITGATGFIGRNLAEYLNDSGTDVLATGRSEAAGAELNKQGIKYKKADITNQQMITECIEPADCVIHCAGKSGDWGSYREFFNTNVDGTRNVIAASRNHGIRRIIFISSPSIYYTGRDRYDISEDEPLPVKQATPYAVTKVIAERELLGLQLEGFQSIMLRPRAVYGPYDNTIIPRILKMAEGKQFPLINNGRATTEITYIDNLIEAVVKCLKAPADAWNESYNVTNGEPITVKDWFSEVLGIFGRPFNPKNIPLPIANLIAGITELRSRLPFSNPTPQLTRFSVGYMGTSMTLSLSKAEKKLGFKPLAGNLEGFEKFAGWYKSNSTGE